MDSQGCPKIQFCASLPVCRSFVMLPGAQLKQQCPHHGLAAWSGQPWNPRGSKQNDASALKRRTHFSGILKKIQYSSRHKNVVLICLIPNLFIINLSFSLNVFVLCSPLLLRIYQRLLQDTDFERAHPIISYLNQCYCATYHMRRTGL